MTEQEIFGYIHQRVELDKNTIDSILLSFEKDASKSNDYLLSVFSESRNYILNFDNSSETATRLHLIAQNYITNMINVHPEFQNFISRIFFDEMKYFLILNEPDKCIAYSNRLMALVNRDYTLYPHILSMSINALLQLKMNEEAAPLTKKLEVYVLSHYCEEDVKYGLICMLIYSFAILGEKSKYQIYKNKLSQIAIERVSEQTIKTHYLYYVYAKFLIEPLSDEDKLKYFELIFKEDSIKNYANNICNQFNITTSIFEKVWNYYSEQYMIDLINKLASYSNITSKKLGYFHWLFEKMNISTEKYSDLYKTYLQTLKDFYSGSSSKSTENIKEEMVRFQVESKYRKQANIDALSNLSNRYKYETKLTEIKSHKTLPENLSFMIADLNDLKVTNDRLGHNAGDEMIIAISQILKANCSAYGEAYRVGGDEFIAILDINKENLQKLINKIKLDVIHWSGKLVKSFTVSIGGASSEELDKNAQIEELINLMDNRMYIEKNRYHHR